MIDKELYKTLNDRLPIFFKSWWLDAVCEGGEWCAESHDINGNIDSVFVYFIKKKFGLKYIVMPPLTQFLGEYSFSDNDLKVKKQISRHYIQTLPKTLFTSICMSHSFDYWSPYFWNGFGQTTRYSLRINDLSNVDTVFSNFDGSKQRNIRKADKIMKVDRGMSADDFYAFFQDNEKLRGNNVSFSKSMFCDLHKACIDNQSGEILFAHDNSGNVFGALFIVWDFECTYALTYTFSPNYRNLGIGDLLMFEAVKFASNKTKLFDFEGSMIENIEQSYSRFGSVPTEYYQIFKSSKFFSVINIFHKLF